MVETWTDDEGNVVGYEITPEEARVIERLIHVHTDSDLKNHGFDEKSIDLLFDIFKGIG